MIEVGPRNLITDVSGIRVGNAENHEARTGVTVLLPDQRAAAGVDVRGGGPGTRETDLLAADTLVDQIDAIVLSGGSAFGLDAAGGTVSWLAAHDRGFAVKGMRVPIVPSAILFDLGNGGNKDWGDTPPYRALGLAAAEAAGDSFALGNAGAGLGATAGPLKGGLGSASAVHSSGLVVGALAAVNCMGSVTFPDSPVFHAWPYERDGEFGGLSPGGNTRVGGSDFQFEGPASINTTIACVATDALLTKAQCRRVAVMAQDGLARAIRPVHTPLDGDTVFALSTGTRALADPVADVARIGMMAADCLARACARGVYDARSLGTHRSYRDVHGV